MKTHWEEFVVSKWTIFCWGTGHQVEEYFAHSLSRIKHHFWLISNLDALGIRRGEVRVFFKEPWRENIYQLVCSVEDFSTRFKRSDLCMPIPSILSDDMRNINFLGSTPFSFRFSDETLGFLLPLAASGKKIQVRSILLNFSWSKLISPLHNWSQVFCGTMDLTDHASKDNNWMCTDIWICGRVAKSMVTINILNTGRWAKRRFKQAGLEVPVSKITGNVPVSWKDEVMERFRAG